MNFDYGIAKRYFYKLANHYFEEEPDKQDYVQQCFLSMVEYGEGASTIYAAKTALRNIMRPRRPYPDVSAYGSFADYLDYLVPANSNDVGVKIAKLKYKNIEIHFDLQDLAELMGIKFTSLKVRRSRRLPVKLWLNGKDIFPTIKHGAAKRRCRHSTFKKESKEILLNWA